MSRRTRTDREPSIRSSEYVWDSEDAPDSHNYLITPIASILGHQRKKVIDLGCGNGTLTRCLADLGFDVVGIDSSSSGIDHARARNPDIAFSQHDLSNPLPLEHHGRYDAAVCAEVIEHLYLPRSLFEAATDALKPGGMLIVTTPYHGYLKNLALALTNSFDKHWHPLRDFGHVKFFSRRTLLALFLEFNFVDVQFLPVGRIPPFAKSMIMYGKVAE